jgi:hypothetical protein
LPNWVAYGRAHPILTDRSSAVNFIGRYPFLKGSWYGDYFSFCKFHAFQGW